MRDRISRDRTNRPPAPRAATESGVGTTASASAIPAKDGAFERLSRRRSAAPLGQPAGDAFPALPAATRRPRFACDYIGVVPAVKGQATMRVSALGTDAGLR